MLCQGPTLYQGPTIENDEIIDILSAAKERLFERGWTKGTLGDEEGPNCLAGAICRVTGTEAVRYTGKSYAVLETISRAALTGNSVATFNDRHETTFDAIIEIVDRTIKILEQPEGK